MKIIEDVAVLRGPGFQRDVASLRLSSKFLHDVATPYFYKVIENCGRSHTDALVAQLQVQPKLCASTRAIWWDEKISKPDMDKMIETSDPYILKFDNLEEVAFCARIPVEQTEIPLGYQYSFRDVGPWCDGVDWSEDCGEVFRLQTTPSLWVRTTLSAQARNAQIQSEMSKRPRAIWACHVIAPSLDDPTIAIPKTCTHFTITLFEHSQMPEMELAKNFDELMWNHERFPLLQHLHVRLISFGSRPNGLPTKEDIPAYLDGKWPTDPVDLAQRDAHEWEMRSNQIKYVLLTYKDKRTSFETIRLPGVQSQTRYEDMRKFIRKEWRERVWGRPGPWPKPPTQLPAKPLPPRVAVPDPWDF